MNLALRIAKDIMAMNDELEELRYENERLREYEKKYHDLLSADIQHGEQMMGNWLNFCLSDKVTIKAD